MSLPWEHQPAVQPQQYRPPAQLPPVPVQPQYQPSVQAPYSPAQQMRPDIPVTATNTQTGQQVKLDMGSVIQQAVNDALRENSRHAAANATQAMQKKAARSAFELDGDETVEEAFQSGAVTTMTFVRGIALDIGVGLVAAFATLADGPGFSAFDKELWMTVVPALVMKTVVQTAMSFVLKAKYK